MTFTEIPLRRRDGRVVGVVVVDSADAEAALVHRWCLAKNGYAMARIDGRLCYLHRWLLAEPRGQIDHRNRNKLDNRRSNLRSGLTDAENKQNVPARGGSSRHRGVFWNRQRQRWEVRFGCPAKVRKFFKTEDEAAAFIERWRAENLAYA